MVQNGCARIIVGGVTGANAVPLTRADLEPWIAPQAKAYLVGPNPAGADLAREVRELFRGVLG